LQKGAKVQLIDGKGGLFEATITLPDPKQCRLQITATLPVSNPRNFNLHIAIAPTKNIDRFEWFIEKAVEIGIDTITPVLCQRSERKILRTDRLQKLIWSTMKQAKVTYLPILNELTDYQSFIGNCKEPQQSRFIAHCEETSKRNLKDALMPGSDIIILIGPEGDFSPEEIKLATNNHFMSVSLGQNRLRTETAGIVACLTANLYFM
jgi:16S rRNA (uracil1498-N3)-methyltransferase